MKSYVAASVPPSKRRWKWFATAVLVLVFFSLLVPLAFLLGLHNRLPSGYLSDDGSSTDSGFESYEKVPSSNEKNPSELQGDQSRIVDDLMKRFSKDMEKSTMEIGEKSESRSHLILKGDMLSNSQVKDGIFHPEGIPHPQVVTPETLTVSSGKEVTSDETRKPCELEYGSYCLWSVEHKEELKDFIVKKLKDQLFVARAYYPSIAKRQSQEKLSREVKQNIQDHERMLSEAIVDADLPTFVEKNIQKMDEIIVKAKSLHVDCNNVDKKLRQILDLTEDEAHFHTRQGAFLYHLGVQTTPKSLHCLSMRLTVEYFRQPPVDTKILLAEKLDNPALHHFVIFSKNILASSVTVNSTVMNAKESKNQVFHLLTDGQNYYAMKFWFSKNSYKDAVVHVLNIEDLGLNDLYDSKLPHSLLSEEFRISILDSGQPSSVQMRTEYISIFSHSHFLLPDIFKNLKKVVVLDDDVVVQQDLSPLWNLDMKGKVNGAVQSCNVRFSQLKHYLGRYKFNNDSCAWMSGLNIVDLEKWREHHIAGIHQILHKEVQNMKVPSWRAAALPISLLAFQDLIYPLNETWVVSGLGKDYGVSKAAIEKAAVLHYNGNMKPWLELGVPKYKLYWRNFLTSENQFMDECNANP